MLVIINNLPSACLVDINCQDDVMSQILCLIVASAGASLVYHIPECKPYLAMRRSKNAQFHSDLKNLGGLAENESARP
ncbi:hypothetical protein JJE66_24305 [Bradyrhizobium diazoefficiens]|uniref:hypothetical protein n=1 Tax=Bradyrhizobium diazoefficiens TaxID=1355477 RepID=UPI00190ABE8A|nr:hypothetical protein [Bradyrhizobium diazoefficiens]MBK3664334.1 hypothetical protein [Bradyrhizobium diazoefficiens]